MYLSFDDLVIDNETHTYHSYFLDCAQKLYCKAFGFEMPNEVFQALKNKKNLDYLLDDYKIIVHKERFNNKNLTCYGLIIQVKNYSFSNSLTP